MLNGLNELRLNEELTDFTICVDTRRFSVHKTVLAGSSAFFKVFVAHFVGIGSLDGKKNTLL